MVNSNIGLDKIDGNDRPHRHPKVPPRLTASNFAHLLQHFEKSIHRAVQLSPGRLGFAWDAIDLGGIVLSRIAVTCRAIDLAATDDDTLVVAARFVMDAGSDRGAGPGGVVVFAPGSCQRRMLEAGWTSVEIFVSTDRIAQEGLPVRIFLKLQRLRGHIPLPDELVGQYRRLAEMAFPAKGSRARRSSMRTAVLDLLTRTATHIERTGHAHIRPRWPKGSHLATRAMELVEQDRRSRLRVGEVADALGVSRRALNYAFQDALGLSLYRYMLVYRLCAARRLLKQASRPLTTVAEIARKFGFNHPGRFTADYRDLFLELPSQTLPRSSRQLGSLEDSTQSRSLDLLR